MAYLVHVVCFVEGQAEELSLGKLYLLSLMKCQRPGSFYSNCQCWSSSWQNTLLYVVYKLGFVIIFI